MAVLVSFTKPSFAGSVSTVGLGGARAYESITVGSASSGSAQDGEIALISSTETATVLIATGSAPDAGATAATAATTASIALPPGVLLPVVLNTGDKIDTAALA